MTRNAETGIALLSKIGSNVIGHVRIEKRQLARLVHS